MPYNDSGYTDDPEMPQEQSMEGGDDNQSDEKTALVPKAFCKDMRVGDTFEVKIVRELDNELEISYNYGPGDKEDAMKGMSDHGDNPGPEEY